MKYAGHIARDQNQPEKWNVAAINWIPYGQKRKKGRPATRWVDEIVNRVGPKWMSVTWRKTECGGKVCRKLMPHGGRTRR